MDTVQYIIDLFKSLITELLRFRTTFAIVFTLVLAAVVMVALSWQKNYVSSAKIVKDVTNVIEPLLRGAAETSDIDKNEKVSDVMLSRRLMEKVVVKLGGKSGRSPEEQELALAKLRAGLSVVSIGRSGVVTNVSFSADSPTEAYETLVAVVDSFLEDRLQDKQRKSHEAHDFISQQAENYRRRLESAELRLKEFKSQSVDVTEASVKSRISELSSNIELLKISIGESIQTKESIRQQIHIEGENVSLKHKVSGLEDRRLALVERLDQLSMTYQDSYPDIVTIKSQIAEVESSIRALVGDRLASVTRSDLPLLEELRKQLSSAEVNYNVQVRRLKALEELLNKEHELADEVASNQATLVELTRDYNVTKNLYEKMLSRKENAKLTLALNDEGQGESYKLADPPSYPLRPSGIRALYIFLLAPFVAFCIPLGMLVGFVLFDPRIRSRALLVSKLPEGVQMLASVPHRTTPFSTKILRKDIFVLAFFAVSLMVAYLYVLYLFKGDL